jgi:hypothetical protein
LRYFPDVAKLAHVTCPKRPSKPRPTTKTEALPQSRQRCGKKRVGKEKKKSN